MSLLSSALGSVAADPSAMDPETAISQGEGLFNGAYDKSGGSIAGTVAVAASVVAALPEGAAKKVLSDVMTLGSDVAAGAAMGSVIPGWGTAVGAVVGAAMGVVSVIAGSDPQPPEGDIRSTAEIYVFPPVQAQQGGNDIQSMLTQNCANPTAWHDIRAHMPGFQVPYAGTEAGSGQNEPITYTFGTSWISPPGSTAQSKSAAWFIAQAWLGTNSVSTGLSLSPGPNGQFGDLLTRQQMVSGAQQRAWTILGSRLIMEKATQLINRWYGTRFNVAPYSAVGCPGINEDFVFTDAGHSPAEFTAIVQKAARSANKRNPLDYSYYLSDIIVQGTSDPEFGARSLSTYPSQQLGLDVMFIPPMDDSGGNKGWVELIAMPDTLVVVIAELACLVALGVITTKGADHIALHLVMTLAWLYRRGQEQDKASGLPYGIRNHPNFSRVIGIISARIRHERHLQSKGGAVHTHSTLQHSSSKLNPWLIGGGVAAIGLGGFLLLNANKDK
jgi:hypothetical protein